MSMKHPVRYHQAAEKKRRLNHASLKARERIRRDWLEAKRVAENAGKPAPEPPAEIA